ncbi:hypothetical protein THAOC_26514 [Thalassiosira oceanica]|uniref:Uncharacterized protein n=1 Tax=Thalassiosira oceanica TaxID=159749 RepID=K0RJR0_THAOC|nr:hypothetical protein THAOC_26514 [Thalassiosira oceanica]|eukprot:EJK53948.1 hypothetical protein THAOC_26514 [Thalassiosira oceanica]
MRIPSQCQVAQCYDTVPITGIEERSRRLALKRSRPGDHGTSTRMPRGGTVKLASVENRPKTPPEVKDCAAPCQTRIAPCGRPLSESDEKNRTRSGVPTILGGYGSPSIGESRDAESLANEARAAARVERRDDFTRSSRRETEEEKSRLPSTPAAKVEGLPLSPAEGGEGHQ